MRAPRRLPMWAVMAAGVLPAASLWGQPQSAPRRPTTSKIGPGIRPIPPAVRPLPAPVPTPPATNEPPLSSYPAPTDEILPVSKIRSGMKGYGLTVFRGATIERFGVEVVDVMPRSYMGEPLILVRLSGGPITARGAFLIQGMSGSPIYIDGKLIGAFSQGNAWPKDPLGMVTPIESMMEALDEKLPSVPAGATAQDWQPSDNAQASLFNPPAPETARVLQRFRPMSLPVTVSGVSSRGLQKLAGTLAPFGMSVLQGPGSMPHPVKTELVPGAAVGVALMLGDVEVSAIGTVTYRKGDRILAFGHPMMQLGATQFPLTSAWIHEVFSGFDVSHKIGSAGQVLGTINQDRPFSVAGKLGAAPPMIPVHYAVKDLGTGRHREFKVQITNHPLLVGQLLTMAVNEGIMEVHPVPGDTTARVDLTVETAGAGTIRRSNVVFDPQAIDVTALRDLSELSALLSNNAFRRVAIKDVKVAVTLEPTRPTAVLERIAISQDRVSPGEELEFSAIVRPYRKEPVLIRETIRVPEYAASGRALLLVHGGSTRIQLSGGGLPMSPGMGQLPSASPSDAGLPQAIRRFEQRERNDQLVARVLFPTSAININGRRLAQFPSHLTDVLRSTRATSYRSERDEAKTTYKSEWLLDGLISVPITIEKDDHAEKPRARPSSQGPLGLGGFPGLPQGPSPLPLSAGEDDLSVIRVEVNGQVRAFRFTPELEEQERNPELREKVIKVPVGDGKKPSSDKLPPEAAKPATPPARPAADSTLVGRAAVLWTQSGQSDFDRGTHRNTAVTTSGEVRMSPDLRRVHLSAEPLVWSVAGLGSSVYAGTGNTGRILKVEGDGKTTVLASTDDLHVLALLRDGKGQLLAGTGPTGRLLRVDPAGKSVSLLDLEGTDQSARYVLSLAAAEDGTVYAGTGPEGRIFKVSPDGKAAELCRLPVPSITSLALDSSGNLYAGTAEEGAVYRVRLTGGGPAAAMFFDTDQNAITGLATDSRGHVYAACAPSGDIYRIDPGGSGRLHYTRARSSLTGLLIDRGGNLVSCGANSVVRIEPDGTASFLTEPKGAQFTAVAWDEGGRLVAGSANQGAVWRLAMATEGSFESTIHDARYPARWGRIRYAGSLPNGGKMKLQTRSGDCPDPDATWSDWSDPLDRETSQFVASPPARFLQYRVLFTAGEGTPSLREVTVSYVTRNQAPRLTLAAPVGGEVLRGTLALKWSAVDPDKDTLTYRVEYTADAGANWKPVGAAVPKPGGSPSPSSPAPTANRAAGGPSRAEAEEALKQFQEEMAKDKSLSPEQRQQNLEKARALMDKYFADRGEAAPPMPSATPPPTPRPTGPQRVATGVTREATISWDTTLVPDGVYQIRVVVTDLAANPSEPLTDVKVSEPFVVVNTAPQLFVFEKGIAVDAERRATVSGFATGRVSLKGAQYRLDEGDWFAIDADDLIWDAALEQFRFQVPPTTPGEHTLELKVVDLAGNARLEKARYKVP